ncbi:MAG TPA: ATP-binding protein [Candidatus Limiplasma sp.]|nr:ATP-binding protein [Candidatus Limiplasma sp.]HPS81837.1 ATP-binding protein [Candidatus Limiplasma sp.]
MKATLGHLRRADQDFQLIEPGDRIAVGVSGGKDSLLMLYALSLYRHIRNDFTLQAVMLVTSPTPTDTGEIERFCEKLDVPLTVRNTPLYRILFESNSKQSPCPLCARMRRACLCQTAQALGCGKLALGHHREDALETLLMSLIYEGRFHTFHPKTRMSRTGVTVIRPLIYMPEKEIIHMARTLKLPVLLNPCPANGHTKRQEMKELLAELSRRYPRLRDSMLAALQNNRQYSLWDKTPNTQPAEED